MIWIIKGLELQNLIRGFNTHFEGKKEIKDREESGKLGV